MSENEIIFDMLDAIYRHLPYVGIPHYEGIVIFLLILLTISLIVIFLAGNDIVDMPEWVPVVTAFIFVLCALGLLGLKENNDEMKKNRYVEILMHDQETLGHVQRLRKEIRYFKDSGDRK